MRGKQAKRLRRLAYGDFSLKEKRVYAVKGDGSRLNTGRRALYLGCKDSFKHGRRGYGKWA